MSLEDYSPDIDSGGEEGGQSAESSREVSEKFKESVKKAGAGIKRTTKDEKKAKRHDLLLASFLVKIILDKKYDELLPFLFQALNSGFSSNFLLGILSLINIEISDKIRELSGKQKIHFEYQHSEELQEFHDNDLDGALKDRINSWVEDMVDIVSIEYSHVLTQELMKSLHQHQGVVLTFMSHVFIFFFHELNIQISPQKAESYSEFILGEVKKTIHNLDIQEV